MMFIWDRFVHFLFRARLGHLFILGAGVKSVNTGVVIGDKLDNQIFEGSHLAGWKIKIRQLLSLKCSRNFFFFNIYTNA